jgi:hypothetical protein
MHLKKKTFLNIIKQKYRVAVEQKAPKQEW